MFVNPRHARRHKPGAEATPATSATGPQRSRFATDKLRNHTLRSGGPAFFVEAAKDSGFQGGMLELLFFFFAGWMFWKFIGWVFGGDDSDGGGDCGDCGF